SKREHTLTPFRGEAPPTLTRVRGLLSCHLSPRLFHETEVSDAASVDHYHLRCVAAVRRPRRGARACLHAAQCRAAAGRLVDGHLARRNADRLRLERATQSAQGKGRARVE